VPSQIQDCQHLVAANRIGLADFRLAVDTVAPVPQLEDALCTGLVARPDLSRAPDTGVDLFFVGPVEPGDEERGDRCLREGFVPAV
jgi:hypothetical protein